MLTFEKGVRDELQELETEIKRLHEKIGQLVVVREF